MAEPFFGDRDRDRIHGELEKILSSKLSMGEQVSSLESEFAKCVGRGYAVAMNSCTSALEAALKAVGVEGKEVIVPTQTFIATAAAVVNAGGRPIFAEITEDDMCLDVDDVKSKVNHNTVAVITVHIFGRISRSINDLQELCEKSDVCLIEDAAHGPGGIYENKRCGQFGDAACFSFYSTKILGAGEGGVLVTDSKEIAKAARSYALRGLQLDSLHEQYVYPGRNVRLTEVNALLMRVQLESLEEKLHKRREIASIYIQRLSKVDRITVLCPKNLEESSFWKFPILLDEIVNRQDVVEHLHRECIFVDTAYDPPVHKQPAFAVSSPCSLVRTEMLLKRHVCLPCHDRMQARDVHRVADRLIDIVQMEG